MGDGFAFNNGFHCSYDSIASHDDFNARGIAVIDA
jgi:hypothetical protein